MDVMSPYRREQNAAVRDLLSYDPEAEHAQAGGMKFDIRNHCFLVQPKQSKQEVDCDVCARPLKLYIKDSRRLECAHCLVNVHKRCHQSYTRTCIASRVDLNIIELHICPDNGLDAQDFRCFECQSDVGYNSMFSEPLVCDYSGKYYCRSCHISQMRVIPARVVHNWDFTPRGVCKTSRDVLMAVHTRPLLNLSHINPSLLERREELRELSSLRHKLSSMVSFLMTCRKARKDGILSELKFRQHFLDRPDMYSLKDLVDLHEKKLLPSLRSIVDVCDSHIRSTCDTCSYKGFVCEKCMSDSPIYPFMSHTTACGDCHALFHSTCFDSSETCPKCERIESRKQVH